MAPTYPLTFPPATKVPGQAGFVPDINAAYNALAAVGGVNACDAQWAGGADPAGALDSAAALNAAASAAASSGAVMVIPPGTYKISGKLNWTGDGLTIAGAGAARTSIIQATANTGVVQVAGYGQRISGLTLGYASQRPASETNSICLSIGKNAVNTWMSRYSDLSLQYGQTLMARDPGCTGTVPLFNCLLSNILLQSWTQSAIHLDSPAGECTGCQFDNIYVSNNPTGTPGADGTSAGYPVYLDSWTESVWNNLTVGGASTTTSLIFTGDFEDLVFNSTHTEGNVYNTSGTAIFELGGSRVSALTLNGLTQQGDTIAAGATVSALLFTSGWGKSAVVNGWVNETLTMGSGASLWFANFAVAGLCRAWLKTSEITYQGTVPGLSTGGNSGSPCYAAWNNLPVGVLGPPSVPLTTVAYLNAYKCHAAVYVTAGTAPVTVAVDGATMAVLPAGAVASFHVPGGSTVTLTYASGTPAWKWYGAAS